MTVESHVDATDRFESLQAETPPEKHLLRLYINGMTERSMNAIAEIKAICEDLLTGGYDLEVINLVDNPEIAERMRIMATPTLVKELPPPVRRLVGDLSNRGRVMTVLQ